jgi:hypothetical protein
MTMNTQQIVAHEKSMVIQSPQDRRITRESCSLPARFLPAMPIRVIYHPCDEVVSFERQGEEIVFRFRASDLQRWESWATFDAFALRETFLAIKTPGEALDLLNISGFFHYGREETPTEGPRSTLTWSQFQRWQELVRLILTDGFLSLERVSHSERAGFVPLAVPAGMKEQVTNISVGEWGWLQGNPDFVSIRTEADTAKRGERKRLCAEVFVRTALEAILATIYVDHLNGINYQLCALKNCNTVYEVSSKHERQYCSQRCAHKASVMRRRAEAAKLILGKNTKSAKKKGK